MISWYRDELPPSMQWSEKELPGIIKLSHTVSIWQRGYPKDPDSEARVPDTNSHTVPK